MESLYRRWLILSMIPRYGNSITVSQIADRLSSRGLERASVRTIQRDLEELSGPFPITSELDGRTYRWSWMEDAPRYDLPMMDPQTALTFHMVSEHLTPLLPASSLKYLESYFSTAAAILSGNDEMPLAQWRDKVRRISRSLQMEPPKFPPGIAEIVSEALLKERCLKVSYRPRLESAAKEYAELNPLGLVLVDSLIYLVATIGDYTNPLQFLVHRLEEVTMLDKPAAVPDRFSLQGYIESGEFSYPVGKETIRLKALFDRDAAAYLHETPLPGLISLTEDAEEETVLLEAELLDSRQLRWWLRGFGDAVEVLEPEALREEFREMAKSMKSIYR
jgi:predicted DNA-binding transcriptional regulator YafY